MKNKLKVFTWHIHGSYLYYLSFADAEIYVPFNSDRTTGYAGLPKGGFPWPKNLHEIHGDDLKNQEFDVILFQNKKQYVEDQYTLFSKQQLNLPKIYVEHDPPREHPVNTKHVVDDQNMLLVHVSYFNNLMWDSNSTPTTVIEHGVPDSNVQFTGKLNKGVVMVNGIGNQKRGLRRMGFDIFEYVRQQVPLDLIGMESEKYGGIGEVPHNKLPEFLSQYRFFFNPIRYTSMPLSVIEAMMVGLPIIGLATTEMPVAIQNGESGFVHTNVEYLMSKMEELISTPLLAHEMGENAKHQAHSHYSIERFAKDWTNVFRSVVDKKATVQNDNFQTQIGGLL